MCAPQPRSLFPSLGDPHAVSLPSPRSLSPPTLPLYTAWQVLDAPALQDDYYLNLVDWSSTNMLSVALGGSVYLWSACNAKVRPYHYLALI